MLEKVIVWINESVRVEVLEWVTRMYYGSRVRGGATYGRMAGL